MKPSLRIEKNLGKDSIDSNSNWMSVKKSIVPNIIGFKEITRYLKLSFRAFIAKVNVPDEIKGHDDFESS